MSIFDKIARTPSYRSELRRAVGMAESYKPPKLNHILGYSTVAKVLSGDVFISHRGNKYVVVDQVPPHATVAYWAHGYTQYNLLAEINGYEAEGREFRAPRHEDDEQTWGWDVVDFWAPLQNGYFDNGQLVLVKLTDIEPEANEYGECAP